MPKECKAGYIHRVNAGAVMEQMTEHLKMIKSPNFSSRREAIVDSIIFHHTGSMALQKTLRLMTSQENKVSAHIIIPRNREEGIIQMVDFEMKAWHSGRANLWKRPNVNLFSVGVQLVGTRDSGYTDWQYEASGIACADIMNRFPSIAFNQIVPHESISDRENGPGPLWRWEQFFDVLARNLYGLQIDRT